MSEPSSTGSESCRSLALFIIDLISKGHTGSGISADVTVVSLALGGLSVSSLVSEGLIEDVVCVKSTCMSALEGSGLIKSIKRYIGHKIT